MADDANPTGGGGGGFGGFSISGKTFSDLGGAVSDLFGSQASAKGLRIKAQGDLAEAQTYDLASGLARQNEQFTAMSTRIQTMQADRELGLSLGQTRADVASSGFAASGSALDLLRDSASQGALQHAVLQEQGQITQAGYEEQGKSYDILSQTARSAAAQEEQLASDQEKAGMFGAISKGVGAVAGQIPGFAAAIASL